MNAMDMVMLSERINNCNCVVWFYTDCCLLMSSWLSILNTLNAPTWHKTDNTPHQLCLRHLLAISSEEYQHGLLWYAFVQKWFYVMTRPGVLRSSPRHGLSPPSRLKIGTLGTMSLSTWDTCIWSFLRTEFVLESWMLHFFCCEVSFIDDQHCGLTHVLPLTVFYIEGDSRRTI